MEYNSDFEVRLATLGALGGDTTKKYDSVYSIDLEILKAIEQGGGGGGLNYDQIKNLLASSGVTEIVVNGDGESITIDYDLLSQICQGGMDYEGMKDALSASTSGVTSIYVHNSDNTTGITMDYDLLNQIGQGGGGSGDYLVVDSIDALSGITSPKGGMLAYVQKQPEQALRQVITIEGTGTIYVSYPNDSTNYYINLSSSYDGVNIMANNGSVRGYRGYTNNNFNKVNFLEYQKESCLPYEILFNNGAKANLVSMVDGSTSGQYIYTFYVEKFNDAFPTITFNSSPVATSVTEETVTVTYNPKGLFQYNILLNKWFPYHIYPTYLTQDELDAVCQDVFNYRITFKIWVFTTIAYNTMSWVNYDLQRTTGRGISAKEIYFGGCVTKESINNKVTFLSVRYQARTTSTLSGWWMPDTPSDTEVVRQEALPFEFSTYMYMAKNDNLTLGNTNNKAQSLYIDAVAGSFTGTIYSTTIPVDVSGTTSVKVADMTGINNYQIFISENGTIRFTTSGYDNVYKKMETNADWLAFVYTVNGTTFKFYAAKIVDNGDNTFTVSIFKKDDVGFSFQSGQPYTWTEETNQTVTYKPHIYTRIRNIGDTYLYKIA